MTDHYSDSQTVLGVLDNPQTDQTFDCLLTVSGWFLNGDTDNGRIELMIDGQQINASVFRVHRPDLGAHVKHQSRATTRPGFVAWVDLTSISDGTHELIVRLQLPNSPYSLSPVNFFVRKSKLHYSELLAQAAAKGQVLHREDIYGSGPPNQMPNEEVLNMILHYAKGSILDVGCGIGVYIAALSRRGMVSQGLEVNAQYVSDARTQGLSVQLYDGKNIPYDDNYFDTVIAVEVLEHVPHWENLLREMVRVARHRVLISVPNIGAIPEMSRSVVVPWHLLEGTHVNFFTPSILAHKLVQIPGITYLVYSYGTISVNGISYHSQVFAVLDKDLTYLQQIMLQPATIKLGWRHYLREARSHFRHGGLTRLLYEVLGFWQRQMQERI